MGGEENHEWGRIIIERGNIKGGNNPKGDPARWEPSKGRTKKMGGGGNHYIRMGEL